MGYGSLEVKVISCKDLKVFNFFKKLLVSAVVSIVSDEPDKAKPKQRRQLQQRQKIPTDKDGGRNPEWNRTLHFDLGSLSLDAETPLFLKFDLRNESVLGNRSIGEVKVPVKDLIDESNGAVRFVSYQVRSSDGEANGVLNFSYKVNVKAKTNPEEEISSPMAVSEKIQYYPSVEDESSSRDVIRYPCLDDIVLSPSPTINIPFVGFYDQTRKDYSKTLSIPSPLIPKPWEVSEEYNRHSHGGFAHAQGLYGLVGYPSVGQRFEGGSWRLGPGSGGVQGT